MNFTFTLGYCCVKPSMTFLIALCSAPLQTAITDTLPETSARAEALGDPAPELEILPHPAANAATAAMTSTLSRSRMRYLGLYIVILLESGGRRRLAAPS